MCYWLMNRLFGCKYAIVDYGFNSYLRRIRFYKNGDQYVWIIKGHLKQDKKTLDRYQNWQEIY